MAKKQPESAKTKANKRNQAASDKTFGLKNKNKSSKVQAYVKQVEQQADHANAASRKRNDQARAAEKKAAEAAKLEALKLFQPVQVQKVPFGVDPKTVVCSFFKQGMCTKGSKCKFSHNLDLHRKQEKRDLYADDKDKSKENDSMEGWDDEKLAQVVMSKHGNPRTTTDIICKYFIEAVENCKYGWFWQCPNGESCKYRHSLPPGFKLKTKEEQRLEREMANNKKEISIEEFIEVERLKLPKDLTPVTLETFLKWKEQRKDKKRAEEELEAQKKKAIMSGKQLMDSGRFTEIADDDNDEDAWDLDELRRRTEEVEDGEEDQTEEQ